MKGKKTRRSWQERRRKDWWKKMEEREVAGSIGKEDGEKITGRRRR